MSGTDTTGTRFSLDDFRERAARQNELAPDAGFGDHVLNPEFADMLRANASRDAAVLIGVTEEGQELFRARKRHRRARLDELMAGLPAEDRETLLRCARDVEPILGRLMERAESARRDECEGHQAGGAR